MASTKSQDEMRRNMVAASVCIGGAVVLFNPLDCLRIRWQVSRANGSLFGFARQVVREEGFRKGLWAPGYCTHFNGPRRRKRPTLCLVRQAWGPMRWEALWHAGSAWAATRRCDRAFGTRRSAFYPRSLIGARSSHRGHWGRGEGACQHVRSLGLRAAC